MYMCMYAQQLKKSEKKVRVRCLCGLFFLASSCPREYVPEIKTHDDYGQALRENGLLLVQS